jgi:hypothetical protein
MNRCGVCGAETILDRKTLRTVCSTCNRGPAVCSCKPVAFVPAWIQRRNDGLLRAKELAA